MPPTGKRTAYGGVVLDANGRVLLREPSNHFDGYVWTFPKGRPNPGEAPEDAARREVLEETGVVAEILARLPGTFVGGTTENVFFVMRLVQDTGQFDAETWAIRWVTMEEAPALLAQTTNAVGRERDRAVLAGLRAFMSEVP